MKKVLAILALLALLLSVVFVGVGSGEMVGDGADLASVSSPGGPGPPVDCAVGPWTCSQCSEPCGDTGTQQCTRVVVRPAKRGGAACPPLKEERECNRFACPPPPVDCVVSDWQCTACSAPCDGGTKECFRTVLQPAERGGIPCPGLQATLPCNLQPCPVDCVVSDWWCNQCSVPCGGGTQECRRNVLQPPLYGGAACPALQETQDCNTDPCCID